MELSPQALRRYARHLSLPEIGLAGQKKICAARVLCVGAGGLGSPVLLYLAAAGVGTLGIADDDVVDVSNLHRQILHSSDAAGRPKTASARDALQRLNPEVRVVTHAARLTRANARAIIQDYDVVVDGSDNFPTRYLVNDACVLLGKPNVYGSIFRFEGQVSLLAPHLGGPCYRCLYPQPPPPGTVPGCVETGVLGVLPGVIGCLQATETLKFIAGIGTLLLGRLLVFDALAARFREIKVRRDPRCPLCGQQPTIQDLGDYDAWCAGPPARPPATLPEDEADPAELQQALTRPTPGIRVVDVREPHEAAVTPVPGATLLPFSQLAARWGELAPDQTLLLCCQAGVRSRQAAQWLKRKGFKSVKSVRGGLQAWARQFAPDKSA